MTTRDPRTGRFKTGSLVEHTHEEIVSDFVAAAQPPVAMPRARRRRWTLPVMLAVAVVAGCLAGVAARDKQLAPTIHTLHQVANEMAQRARHFENTTADQRSEIVRLREDNARLWLAQGGALQVHEQDKATDKAAAHDLHRAKTALQYDQDIDAISDRAKTWVALRAVEKAEKRLKGQP